MSSIMRQKDIRPAPALIEFKGMKFLITDRPSDNNIQNYIMVRVPRLPLRILFFEHFQILKSFFCRIQELKKNNVSTVVRVCEPSYKTEELDAQGISVRDCAYDDGTPPPQHIVNEWLEILRQK